MSEGQGPEAGDATRRFTVRAQAYSQGRPGYPAALGELLHRRGLLRGGVADLGAGTGLFTRLLLEHGAAVDAVEPNDAMRAALEQGVVSLRLRVHAGTSEATGLPSASVGLVTAAQAAHWFDPHTSVQEFRRVLTPGGSLLLVWNDWRGSPQLGFTGAYGRMTTQFDPEHGIKYIHLPEVAVQHYFSAGYEKITFANPQLLSRERLQALAESVSSLPQPGTPRHTDMTRALDEAFAAHAEAGTVTLEYITHAYLGALP